MRSQRYCITSVTTLSDIALHIRKVPSGGVHPRSPAPPPPHPLKLRDNDLNPARVVGQMHPIHSICPIYQYIHCDLRSYLHVLLRADLFSPAMLGSTTMTYDAVWMPALMPALLPYPHALWVPSGAHPRGPAPSPHLILCIDQLHLCQYGCGIRPAAHTRV
jgi:hypothetical protein